MEECVSGPRLVRLDISGSHSDCSIQIREPSDTEQWTYINSQNDADAFYKIFAGFHDSTLDKIQYVENYRESSLIVTFDNSGWYGVVELYFEGLIFMNLRPVQKNYSREIFSAYLFVEMEKNKFKNQTSVFNEPVIMEVLSWLIKKLKELGLQLWYITDIDEMPR